MIALTSYVLVPGANHGGWWYQPVVEKLRAAGHNAIAVTLSGLDPDGSPVPAANLDDHVAEVRQVLLTSAEPVVLAGHSYGGSVITGAADQQPTSVSALLYLDAFVPEDGDSCWSMTNDEQRIWYGGGSRHTGLAVEPLPFFDARTRPHPLGTLMQAAKLTGAWKSVPRKHYVYAAGADWQAHTPFTPTRDRLRSDPDWTVIEVNARHNLLADGPDLMLGLLLDLA